MAEREPFWIVLVGAPDPERYVKDFGTRDAAEASCRERNARAVDMGLIARYEVIEVRA